MLQKNRKNCKSTTSDLPDEMSTFKKVDTMMQLNKLTNIKQISEKGKLENAKTWNRTLLLEILVFYLEH